MINVAKDSATAKELRDAALAFNDADAASMEKLYRAAFAFVGVQLMREADTYQVIEHGDGVLLTKDEVEALKLVILEYSAEYDEEKLGVKKALRMKLGLAS